MRAFGGWPSPHPNQSFGLYSTEMNAIESDIEGVAEVLVSDDTNGKEEAVPDHDLQSYKG